MGQSPDEGCVIINAALLGRRPQFNIGYHYHHHNSDLLSSICSVANDELDYFNLSNRKSVIAQKVFNFCEGENFKKNWHNNHRDYVRFIEFFEILVADKSCHKSPLRLGDKTDKTAEMSK